MQADGTKKNGKWYFDSGCTSHMTGDKSLLSDFKEKKGPKIKFGGGVKLTTLGSGNTSLGKLKFGLLVN